MELVTLAIDEIVVEPRVREDLGDLSSLRHSIEEVGLLFPVVVNKNRVLISGARRLEACRLLGRRQITALVVDCSDPVKCLDMQCQENLCRKDLTERELDKEIDLKTRYLRKGYRQEKKGLLSSLREKIFGA
jgi:ParB/RepB/Spo0J family partition protein